MAQILLAYGLSKETVTSIMMFYMKAMVHLLDGNKLTSDILLLTLTHGHTSVG